MIYHNFDSYTQALSNYINTPGKIINGNGYVLSNGEWVTDEEYNRHNSRPAFQYPNRQNSDGTNIASEIIIKKRK
jgi:hypothetical protein